MQVSATADVKARRPRAKRENAIDAPFLTIWRRRHRLIDRRFCIRNFQNRSRHTSLAACEVSVSYDIDLKALERLLSDSLPDMYLAHQDLYLASPRYLGVTELADSGVNIKLVVDTKEENVFAAQRTENRRRSEHTAHPLSAWPCLLPIIFGIFYLSRRTQT